MFTHTNNYNSPTHTNLLFILLCGEYSLLIFTDIPLFYSHQMYVLIIQRGQQVSVWTRCRFVNFSYCTQHLHTSIHFLVHQVRLKNVKQRINGKNSRLGISYIKVFTRNTSTTQRWVKKPDQLMLQDVVFLFCIINPKWENTLRCFSEKL